MTEEVKARRKRRVVNRRMTEPVDFIDSPEIHAWIAERAKANFRSVSQEIVSRLAASKRSIEAGRKNLKGKEEDA